MYIQIQALLRSADRLSPRFMHWPLDGIENKKKKVQEEKQKTKSKLKRQSSKGHLYQDVA